MIANNNSRIVVTGMGAVSPLGCGVELVWSRLTGSQSGLRRLAPDFAPDVTCQVAALVPGPDETGGFNANTVVPAKDLKKMDRFIQFALGAAEEAITQAGWRAETEAQRVRTATVIASGIGGFHSIANAVRITDTRGPKRLSPFTAPSFLSNLAAGWVSIYYGYKGPIGAPVTACAASAQAIGDAARLIRSGEADVAVCGGAEAAINRVSLGAFGAARALSTGFNETPTAASRPFDSARDGFVMGEGAGILVIESLDHALARGATPLAEFVGYGTTADAYHVTAGPENGDGAARAMFNALAQAGIPPARVGHLNAHATSTPVGDRGEIAAIKTVFGAGPSPAISATKSATGHMLGAAGGIEAIFTVMALRRQILPPTLNLSEPDSLAEGRDQDSTHSADVDYSDLLPALFELKVGRFYIQLASECDPGSVLKLIKEHVQPNQMIFVGVIDPINPKIETPEEVRDRILEAAEYIPLDQLGSADDCGFSPFGDDTSTSREIAFEKIRARVTGTEMASRRLGA